MLDGFEHRRAIAQARLRLFGSAPVQQIGRYTIERRIGAGGMGEVYLGHDEELDRKVAIKRVLAGFTSEREQARLRSEARALAKLSHPNVVQVYEIGEHEQRTFLAMEFVEGQTLAAWLAEQPRDWRAVLERFVAAGEGLAAAHRAGVIHRDFKPDNVLLGLEGSVRVADFGLALAGERPSPSEAGGARLHDVDRRFSVTGSVVGTIRYMAIEQLLGEAVDERSDQFSFCVALYEALWAGPPFAIDSLDQRLDALEAGEPRPPSPSPVPRGLWRILRRGLARAPDDRWPDMATLLAALAWVPKRRRWLLAGSVVAPLLSVALAGRAWVEQRDADATIEACAAEGRALAEAWNDEVRGELEQAFVATGLEFAPTSWTLTRERMDTYADEWGALREATCVEAEVDHSRSEASREQIVDCLDEARATFVALASTWTEADAAMVSSATMAVAGLPVLAMCRDAPWLAGRVAARGDIEPQVSRLRAQLDRVKALKLAVQFDRGLAEANAVLSEAEALGWLPLIAEARLAVGDLQDRLGQQDAARTSLHRALLEGLRSGHDFIALRASIALTVVESRRFGSADAALDWAALAEAMIDRLELRGTMHEASTLHALGRAQRLSGDLEAALATHRRVLALDEAVHGPNHPDNAISLNAIGALSRALGDLDAAELAHERALAIQRESLGRAHPDVANSLAGLAYVAAAKGQQDRAIDLVRAALGVELAALGPEHVNVADTLDLLSTLLIERGSAADIDEALLLRTRMLAIREAALGPDHTLVAWSSISLGESLMLVGDPARAAPSFARALAIFESAESPDGEGLAAAREGLAAARERVAE